MSFEHRVLQLALLLVAVAAGGFALEQEITLGSPWGDVSLEGVRLTPGRWGLSDLVLDDGDYEVRSDTRLLVHFDTPPFMDATGSYTAVPATEGSQRLTRSSTSQKIFGEGSGAFQSGLAPVVFSGPPLLGAADFTIEFWLYPAHISDGERFLSWNADRWDGSQVSSQSMTCSLQGRTLVWQIGGAFLNQPETISIKGLTALVPRAWAHHMLRFDSTTGLLEYLVNGLPEAVTYVTSDGRDGSPALLPFSEAPGQLTLGEAFTGLVDELRVSHRFVQQPQLTRYSRTVGTAVSSPEDMGHAGSRLLRIDSEVQEPGQTAVILSYRIADDLFDLRTAPWVLFVPGEPMGETVMGRFVQVRAELRPDSLQSPSLSRLTIVYEPDVPPPPPAQLIALAGNGTITLQWRPVLQDDVKGYLVYYGVAPGRYAGQDSAAGRSPIDVGDVTTATLEGMTNGELYYLAVVTYDTSSHQSVFSTEVTARPTALGGGR